MESSINRSSFIWIILCTLTVKIGLSWFVPITGDEAYFLTWGQYPALGYYDHPPITGWIAALLSICSHHILIYRLFSLATGLAIGLFILTWLRHHDVGEEKSFLISLFYFLSPFHLLNILFTTDTPLILFVFLSALCCVSALKNNSLKFYAASGMFLGLAFLSKYFAILLVPAFIAILWTEKRWRSAIPLFTIGLVALPFGLINLYWNYTHCWTNVLFNTLHRNQTALIRPMELLAFVGVQLYLITPWLFYFILRRGKQHWQQLILTPTRPFLWLFGLPITILGLVSFKNSAAHWVLSFYPFLFPLAVCLKETDLRSTLRFTVIFSSLHIIILTLFLILPVSMAKNLNKFPDVIMHTKGRDVAEALKPFTAEYVPMAATGYTTAAVMSYYMDEYLPVFLSPSKYGRQNDFITDFRPFNGHNIILFAVKPLNPKRYRRYFREVELKTISVHGATFHLLLGKYFKFEEYKAHYLEKMGKLFYTVPQGLPCRSCPFNERYGFVSLK